MNTFSKCIEHHSHVKSKIPLLVYVNTLSSPVHKTEDIPQVITEICW